VIWVKIHVVKEVGECSCILYTDYRFVKLSVLLRYYIPAYITRYSEPVELSECTLMLDFQ